MINAILNLLRSDGYITVHKTLIQNIGLVPATVFSELCSKYKYYFDRNKLKNGYFYFTIPKCEAELGLSRKEQDTAFDKLITCGLIEKKVMKLKGNDSPKRYIKITQDLNLILKHTQGKGTQAIENTEFAQKGQIDTCEKDKLENVANYGENDLKSLKTLAFSDMSKKDISTGKKVTPSKTTEADHMNKRRTHTHTGELEKIVCVDNPIILQEEKAHTSISEVVANAHADITKPAGANTPSNSTGTKHKVVCVDDSLTLQEEIRKITGFKVSIKVVRELLSTSSVERIKLHLDNWYIHKEYQKSEGAGWFITVVRNDILPEKKKTYCTGKENGKKPQRDNFEQREYTREYLESFYTDLTLYMEPESETQKAKPYTYINE